jgi:hypothetical protein
MTSEEATMATTPTTYLATDHAHTLSVMRLFVTGGLTASIVFLLCWVGALVPYSSATHAYTGLFTSAEYTSERALVEGFCWSLLFGGLVGAVFALVYNFTGRLGSR